MPFLSSVESTYGFGRNVNLVAYKYYRWQITLAKTMPPNSACVQASEFLFQLYGVDKQSETSSATVALW